VPVPLVLAFPGQGSLAPEAGSPWADHRAFGTVDAISKAAGVDVRRLLTSAGNDAELVSTENAQLATFALSLCVLDATGLEERASLTLGHSLGEYTALVAAGVVGRDDGARLVAARGAAMRGAAEAQPGGLVAMLGGDEAVAEAACTAVPGLSVANLNGPGQVVLGGPDAALADVTARAKELGFRRAIPLKVGGAFHTPLMAPAAARLAPALAATAFAPGHARVVANVDGAEHADATAWPDLLLRQLTSPVRFESCVRALPAGAVLVECGAGRVLSGLVARIRDDLDVRSVAVPDDLDAVADLR
jgi:[acyl-carrier-protein] S-malonyltransferase